jgi:HlyD family secretion protein
VLLAASAVFLAATLSLLGRRQAASPISATSAKEHEVSCIGHLEPEDGVIAVAAPYFGSRPGTVREVLVKEGDWVQPGQIMAVLDGRQPAEAAAVEAEARLEVAQNQLAQLKAGAKPSEIEAQKAEVARRQSELENAVAENTRFEKLFTTRDVSALQRDEKRLTLERAKESLEEAKAKLDSLTEVRPVDVDLANSQVRAAQAEAKRTRAEVEWTLIRAPVAGRVLKIRIHPGEHAGNQPVFELAKTDHMYVIAEVYETDIGHISVGQRANISSDLFARNLGGSVTEIGSQIAKSEDFPSDPAAFADTRIVKVKVRLDESKPVSSLINGRVTVRFVP